METKLKIEFFFLSVAFIIVFSFVVFYFGSITGKVTQPSYLTSVVVPGPKEGKNQPQPISQCTDSDGGLNIYQFGTVTTSFSNGTNITGSDTCSSHKLLSETYCDGTRNIKLSPRNCPEGYTCQNGRCA